MKYLMSIQCYCLVPPFPPLARTCCLRTTATRESTRRKVTDPIAGRPGVQLTLSFSFLFLFRFNHSNNNKNAMEGAYKYGEPDLRTFLLTVSLIVSQFEHTSCQDVEAPRTNPQCCQGSPNLEDYYNCQRANRPDRKKKSMMMTRSKNPLPRRNRSVPKFASALHLTQLPDRISLKQTFALNDVLKREHVADIKHPALLKGMKKTRGRKTEHMEENIFTADDIEHPARLEGHFKLITHGWLHDLGSVLVAIMTDSESGHRAVRIELIVEIFLQVIGNNNNS